MAGTVGNQRLRHKPHFHKVYGLIGNHPHTTSAHSLRIRDVWWGSKEGGTLSSREGPGGTAEVSLETFSQFFSVLEATSIVTNYILIFAW